VFVHVMNMISGGAIGIEWKCCIYSIGYFKVCMSWLEYARICLGMVQPVNLRF